MATLDSLRGALRVDLRDEDAAAYRWSDGELDRHIQRAARELSLALPRERRTDLTVSVSPTQAFALSTLTDLVRVEAVEFPIDKFPPCYVRFSTWEGMLTVHSDALLNVNEVVRVYWGSLHQLDGSASSVPVWAEEALLVGAAGYAATEWASFATNRANIGGGDVDRDYAAWGRSRLAEFREQLRRLGARNKVRVSRLYSPARSEPGRDVVSWEP